jgi:DNA-directed RNA polymerase subunit RPC12/RpoP
MLKYICPSCGVETTTSLFKNDGFMKKSQYSIPLTEYLGGDLSKYHNQDVKCLKCHQSIKIPQKITLMKGRIAPSK